MKKYKYEKKHHYNLPINKIETDILVGSLAIATTDKNEITVYVRIEFETHDEDKRYDIQDYTYEFISVNEKGGSLVIKEQKNNNKLSNYSLTVVIAIPQHKELAFDITNNVGIILIDKTQGTLRIKSETGKVNIKNHKGKVYIRSNNDELKLEQCRGEFDLQTSNGKISLHSISGIIKAVSSNGAIYSKGCKFVGLENKIDTLNGMITLNVPHQSLLIKAFTQTGAIDTLGLNKFKLIDRVKKVVSDYQKIVVGDNPNPTNALEMAVGNGQIVISST